MEDKQRKAMFAKRNQALTINQVGARPIGSNFELGGGVFTKDQILESRRRFLKVRYGLKAPKKAVGL